MQGKHGNKRKLLFSATISLICISLLIVGVVFSYSNYLTSSLYEQTQSKLQQQIASLNATNSALQENNSQLNNQLTILQSQLQNQLTVMQNNLTAMQTKLNAIQTQVNTPPPSKPQPTEPFNYLVYENSSGSYVAENGATLSTDYSGNDATKVCQNCINSLLSSNGGKIILAGILNLNGPLIVTQGQSNGTIEIDGFGPSTQLIVPDKEDGIDLVGNQAFGYSGPYHAVINDLVLTTGNPPQNRSMQNGIDVKNWFDVSINNVMVFYANNSGVQIQDSADVKLQNVYVEGCGGTEYGGGQSLLGAGFSIVGSKDCYLDNCFSDTNSFGFLITANSNTNNLPNNIFLSDCEATLCQQTGLSIGSANGLVLSDSLVDGSGGDGINVVDSFSVTIANTVVQGNSGNGIVISSQSSNLNQSFIKIQNCNLDSNGKNNIGVYSQNNLPIGNINILDCQITNSGASVAGSPPQPYLWDGVNINTDPNTGGYCLNIHISNCFIGNHDVTNSTQKFGVRSLGNSDYIQIIQNNFFNNLEGNYSLAGAHNSISNNA